MKLSIYQIILLAYLGIMTLIGFVSMGADKKKAEKKRWRIPEKTLFLIAILGGSLGSVLGMQFFRHKTKHWYFALFMPLILLAHIALLLLFFKKLG
ncbi:MAG: DUF1294 domain-containing protein [Clostridia bacterium]|nr:DUF1294 domain-containing protein [Clostridia bacterium]